jgi:hypothetical protein
VPRTLPGLYALYIIIPMYSILQDFHESVIKISMEIA